VRALCIALVVCMHASVTYSHVGSWYMKDGDDLPLIDTLLFLFFQGHLQAFFMGLLFFLGGYFARESLVRRTAGSFLKGRLVRLGAPALLFMAVLHPFIEFCVLDRPSSLPQAYARYVASGSILGGSGPLWFALALLGFSAALSLVPRQWLCASTPATAPGAAVILGAALAVGTVTFAVRLAAPLGSSVLNFQLAYFPQYVFAFAAGVGASRGQWLEALARSSSAATLGKAAVIVGPPALAAVLWVGGVLRGNGYGGIVGGLHWGALCLAVWEQLVGFGLALGVMAFGARFLAKDGAVSRLLCDCAFGVYVVHAPILVLLTVLLGSWNAEVYFKVATLTGAGLAASYGLSWVLRRMPVFRVII
jgi:glucans biosynthesis protein C